MPGTRIDLTRILLAILFLGGLIAGTVWVLLPFLPALVWAATLVIATWPVMEVIERGFGGRRGPAVAVMLILLLLVIAVPLWLAVSALISNASEIVAQGQAVMNLSIPPPPYWVAELPFVGERAVQIWERVATFGVSELVTMAKPYTSRLAQWFLGEVGNMGLIVVQFLLTVLLTGVLFAQGEAAAGWARRFAERLAGETGEQSVHLVAQSIRSVALGIVVTAVVQTMVGAMGLVVAGVPYAGILSAIMLILCVAQVGPGLVLFPAVVWMYGWNDPVWATVLLVFSVIATTFDNLLRPMLIGRSLATPMILILAGVIGGLLAFGLVGLFLGPTILAVSHALMTAWIGGERLLDEPRPSPSDPDPRVIGGAASQPRE